MTEISNESAYFVIGNRVKPKPLQDEYHWVTPDALDTISAPVASKIETAGYDCTQPKAGVVYGK